MKTVLLIWMVLGVAAQAETLTVAALGTVLADIAKNVGGDHVQVVELIKPGTDPHSYEPTPGDIKKISNAQLVLASGLGIEPYLEKLRTSVGPSRFLIAGDSVKTISCESDEQGQSHGEHEADPHWWHSISNVELVSRQICNAFSAANPGAKREYDANTKIFIEKLEALSKWSRLQVARLPKSQRILVTSHDALGYFAKDYNFVILPVQGISTTEQPSSQKVQRLIHQIKDKHIKAVFAENIENPKVLEQITKETGAKIGGKLHADGLGTDAASTYEGMMRSNVTTIVEALQ
jgi:zinc/manganese transport system substrate-binding protein